MRTAVYVFAVLLALYVDSIAGFGTNCGKPAAQLQPTGRLHRGRPRQDTPRNLKIAFFGDQGVRNSSTHVMKLVLQEGAEAIVHGGDYDYHDNPKSWIDSLDNVLGRDFPVFAAIGNHDLPAWDGPNGYAALLEKRMKDQGTWEMCEGELGINMICDYKGVLILNTGVGTRGREHVEYVDQTFSQYPAVWKACNWHKNQRLYQVGGKSDETGYAIFDICRHHGALVATAHEHSYSRTFLMDDFEHFKIGSLAGTNINDPMVVKPGSAPAWVSGIGGQSLRVCLHDLEKNEWWASYGCIDNDVDYGALFCTFNLNGWSDRAHCEFKTIEGVVWDSFWLKSENDERTPTPPMHPKQSHFEFSIDPSKSHAQGGGFAAAVLPATAGGGALQCKPERLFDRGASVAVLQFAGIDSADFVGGGRKQISHAHLELYGLGGAPREEVSFIVEVLAARDMAHASDKGVLQCSSLGQLPADRVASRSVRWQAEEGERAWERHEVWTSPDLSAAITEELARCESCSALTLRVTLVGTAGELRVASGHGDPCLAPTLVVQTA